MKKLLVLLLLVGCSETPKFKVGECIRSKYSEEWNPAVEVIKVGKRKYLVYIHRLFNIINNEELYIEYTDRDFSKIECPKEKIND